MRYLAILFLLFGMSTTGCGDGNVFSSTENSDTEGVSENGGNENATEGVTENGENENVTENSNSEKTLSREEAEKIFDDTRTMLSRTIKHALKLRGNRALEFNFDFEVECPDHGRVYAEASAEVNVFGESILNLYGDIETCSEDGTNNINGWLELDGYLTIMPPSTSLAGYVEGRLAYEGEVEGECDFELTVEIGPLVHFDVYGILCGFEF